MDGGAAVIFSSSLLIIPYTKLNEKDHVLHLPHPTWKTPQSVLFVLLYHALADNLNILSLISFSFLIFKSSLVLKTMLCSSCF